MQDLEEEHLDELKHEAASVPATRIPQAALPELPSAPKTQVGGRAAGCCGVGGAGDGALCRCPAPGLLLAVVCRSGELFWGWHLSLHCAGTHLLPGVQAAPAKTPEELELEALEAEMAQ